MGPVRVWCQWWNAGVEMNRSSGPNRQRRLAWMKKPQAVPSTLTTTGTRLPDAPTGPPSPSTSEPAFYVFGINRGGATAPGPFPGRPSVTFDARVNVAGGASGHTAEVQILNSTGQVTKTVVLPQASIEFSKTHVGVFVPADLLPSTSPPGTADPFQHYSTFWARSWPTIPSRIAGFFPQLHNAPFELKTQPPPTSRS